MTCRACRGNRDRVVTVAGQTFHVCRCGFAALESSGRHDSYWEGRDDSNVTHTWADSQQRLFSNVLTLLEERTRGRHLIDVGGGIGHFCELATRRGWNAHNVEISEYARQQALTRLDAGHVHASLDDLGQTDVATLWCVVGHTTDPRELLTSVRDHLKPGGLLFLTTPNWTFQRLLAGGLSRTGRNIDFHRQDHISMFPRRPLESLLGSVGFTAVEFGSWGVKERCVAFGDSMSKVSITGKRMWNTLWTRAAQVLPADLTSEFQVIARRA